MIAQTKRRTIDVVVEEVRYALEFVMKFTPPNDHAEGRKAVKRDIQRTMRELNPEDITRSKQIKRIVQEGDHGAFNRSSAFWRGRLKNARAVVFTPVEHTRRRDSRGRVTSDHRQVVLGKRQGSKLRAYITKTQARVGWARAGWAKALKAAGGTVPTWVARHSDAAGDVVDGRNNPRGPVFTVINNTRWGQRDGPRIVRNAETVRSNIMKRKLDKLIREEAFGAGARSA